MFTSARAAAVDHLLRIEVSHAHVARLDAGLPPREERQVTEYVAGVTRWRRWLDFLLAGLYRGPYHEMEPMLRQILRLGAYDLLLQQTPAHAAIHEAVELAKRRLRPGAGKLANGLLRTLDRRQDNLPEPDTGDPARDLAIRHSHPTWVVRRWVARLGPEAARALLDWNNARPAYDLRVNTLRQTPEAFRQALEALDVTATPSPFLEAFVRVDRLQPVVQAGWLGEGGCAVQDQSAGLVVHLLDPQPHEQVLDVCAAPGGKALYAALRMQGEGEVRAVDANPRRLALVQRAADQHGLRNLRVGPAADVRALAAEPTPPQADAVLLDAPCTGLGVLSKRADLRWHRTAEELQQLTALQAELLDAAAMLVRPGGRLVYATCTIEPEENEAQVEAFLARNPAFEVEPPPASVPPALLTPAGYLATWPPRDQMDGAFAARLRHRG